LTKPKIALILVQNRICKNEVIDSKNTKKFKNLHIKIISFQIHSNRFYSNNDNILLVIGFKRKFEIFLSKFIKKLLVIVLVDFDQIDGIQNSKSTTSICVSIPKYSSKLYFMIIFLKSSILEKTLDV